jgi:D-amino peptidase
MRVYISVDMEGIAGVVHESQTDPDTPAFAAEYDRFRRLMTAEANAAIEGALEAGATGVLVNDSHWHMRNLVPELLHEGAQLLSGSPKPWSMMEGIEGGFDAALFIGYHARAGTRHAILDHTYADRVLDVRVNGRPLGELGLNAAVAGAHDVPVELVSGDSALAAEAVELLGDQILTVVVKEAVGRHAAKSIAPAVACRLIREGAVRALKRRSKPFAIKGPATFEVDFHQSISADLAEVCPGVQRTGARTVTFTQQDYLEAFRTWRATLTLSSAA